MKRILVSIILFLCCHHIMSQTLAIAYVAVNGNDVTNDGSASKPFATVEKALLSTANDATIIIRGGEYRQKINIAAKSARRSVNIQAYPGELVRIVCGKKIDSAVLALGQSDVYQIAIDSLNDSPYYKIYQHEVADTSTFIKPGERHPLQRGKVYRCESTPLNRVNSLNEVAISEKATYYYDSVNKMLYFKCVDGYNLAQHPIYLPEAVGLAGGNRRITLTVSGIEMLYGGFNLTDCSGARIIDCASKYAFAGGGFIYNMSVGIEFIRCESARVVSSGGNGDGFNGHSRINAETQAAAKHTSVMLVDCWSHDNYDDGYSNHERCEGVVRGGLFEYNFKYGIGSGYGAHESIYNAISRNNTRYGFAIAADITSGEGGYASQMILHNCIAEKNGEAGYLAYTANGAQVNHNRMELYNCMSVNNTVGFEVRDSTQLILRNCYEKGSTIKATGNVTIDNIPLLSQLN